MDCWVVIPGVPYMRKGYEGTGGNSRDWGMSQNTVCMIWQKFCRLAGWHNEGQPKRKFMFSCPKLRILRATISLSAKGLGRRSVKVTSALCLTRERHCGWGVCVLVWVL
jgi:hypothetical protein